MYSSFFSRTRSWHKLLTTAAVALGLASPAMAQVNAYNVTTGTGATWQDLSAAPDILTAANDDTPSGTQTIGFNFNFGGTVYTQYSVSPDGFIRLGGTAASAQYSNSNSATNQPKIFAWWNDLALGGAGNGGHVRSALFGVTPNQLLVIQWNVTIPRNTTGTPNAQFQLTLSEYDSTIMVVYGPASATDGSSGASIGISTSTSDFISLDASRVPSTSVFTTNITNYIGTGYPYVSFTPPMPCQDPPTGGTANAPSLICASTSFNVTLTGHTYGGGQTYQWQSSPDGSAWSNIPGATSSALATSQTSATYYRCVLTCGSSSNSAPAFVGMQPGCGEDCPDAMSVTVYPNVGSSVYSLVNSGNSQNGPNAACSNGSGNVPDDDRWFKIVAPDNSTKLRFETAAGNNNDWVMEVWDGCPVGGTLLGCSDDVVGLMPRLDLCGLTQGNTYYVRLWTYSSGASGRTCSLRVYSDVAVCPVPPANDQCSNATILNVENSCNATNGTTTNSSDGANPSASCNLYGQKLDVFYKVNTGCNNILDVTVTSTTGTHGFNLISDCAGTQVGSNCLTTQGTLNYVGLTPYTDYWVRIWSTSGNEGDFTVCAVGPAGTPPTVLNTTPGSRIGTGTVILNAVPSSGTINWYDAPTGGTLLGVTGTFTTPSISVTTTYYAEAMDGCASATREPVTATVYDPYVPSAPMNASNITHNGALLSWGYTGADPCDSVKVYIKKTGAAGWYKVQTLSGAPSSFQRQQLQPGWNYTWQCQSFFGGNNYWGPTSSFTTAALCATFISLDETTTADSTADVNWSISGTADSFKVLYRRIGTVTWSYVMLAGTSTTLTGLWQATDYEWKVQAFCNGVVATVSAVDSFTTGATCAVPTNLTDVYHTATQHKVIWDTVPGASSYQVHWRLQGAPAWISIPGIAAANRVLTGVADASTYEWRVRTACNGTVGPWSSVMTFTHSTPKQMGLSGVDAVVYPIPTQNGTVSVRFDGISGTEYRIVVTDVLGKVITTQTGISETSNDILVNLSGASKGIYTLSLQLGEAISNYKVVVE